MSGAHVKIEDAALKRELSALLQRLTRPAPALREIGEVIRNSTRQRFKTETAPDGTKWAQNSDITLMRYLQERSGSFRKKATATGGQGLTSKGAKRIGLKKILTNRGFLADTLAYQVGADGRSVAIGSNRVYAAMQQFGGTRAQWPHLWGNIPARPFLPIRNGRVDLSPDTLEDILDVVRHHLSAAKK
jgi:phage gpG-like protein